MALDIGAIADLFLRSWHPLVEIEQMSTRTLAESLRYWGELVPFDERWQENLVEEREIGSATRDEAKRLGIIIDEDFTEIIESFWHELEEKVGKGGEIDYWDWIGAQTYESTVYRAYLTVFMVGSGYANATWNRLLESYKIIHNEVPRTIQGKDKVSLPIMVDYKEWKLWQEG
jgi:hypothetical protein